MAPAAMGAERRPLKRATSSSDNEPEAVLLEPAAPTPGFGENGGSGRRGSNRPEAGGGGGKPWLNQSCYLEVSSSGPPRACGTRTTAVRSQTQVYVQRDECMFTLEKCVPGKITG